MGRKLSAFADRGFLPPLRLDFGLHDHLAQPLKHGRFVRFLPALAFAHQQNFIRCGQPRAAIVRSRCSAAGDKPGVRRRNLQVKLRAWWKAC